MMCRVPPVKRFGRSAVALMALLMPLSSTAQGQAEEAVAAPAIPKMEAAPWPSRVEATYKVSFAGLDIGDFKFQATVNGGTYSLAGNAELSALLGAFT